MSNLLLTPLRKDDDLFAKSITSIQWSIFTQEHLQNMNLASIMQSLEVWVEA